MLFRTRVPRRHRALAMVGDRDDLFGALRAVLDGTEHPCLVRSETAAATHKLAYVFPGQGVQRPGMGRVFYDAVPAFRAEVDRCAEAFADRLGESPLNYLLDEHVSAQDDAGTVQPALFTQMAGLAAVWRSFGIAPAITLGHSQGEIAAAYVSGAISLADAVSVVGIRARAADEFESGDYAMAVVAADRDTCEDVLARCPGWAQLSVINSPSLVGISGDRETVQNVVDTFAERGTFARVIRVQYPAHTSLINGLAEKVRAATQRELQNPKFLDAEIDCLGSHSRRPHHIGPVSRRILVLEPAQHRSIRQGRRRRPTPGRRHLCRTGRASHVAAGDPGESRRPAGRRGPRCPVGRHVPPNGTRSQRVHPQSRAAGRSRPGLPVGVPGRRARRPRPTAIGRFPQHPDE